jgi:hypothetical protein
VIALLYVLALIGAIVLDVKAGIRRPVLLLSLPLLVLDCLGNMVCGQSWRNTMSGEAWHHREHKYWRIAHRAIDALFWWQDAHCQRQALKEQAYGGFWPAYVADWQRS